MTIILYLRWCYTAVLLYSVTSYRRIIILGHRWELERGGYARSAPMGNILTRQSPDTMGIAKYLRRCRRNQSSERARSRSRGHGRRVPLRRRQYDGTTPLVGLQTIESEERCRRSIRTIANGPHTPTVNYYTGSASGDRTTPSTAVVVAISAKFAVCTAHSNPVS